MEEVLTGVEDSVVRKASKIIYLYVQQLTAKIRLLCIEQFTFNTKCIELKYNSINEVHFPHNLHQQEILKGILSSA